tara:strand:+ start:770 stop:907 length:138 start_codon:yes stop_codon:yes gene_type:complete
MGKRTEKHNKKQKKYPIKTTNHQKREAKAQKVSSLFPKGIATVFG